VTSRSNKKAKTPDIDLRRRAEARLIASSNPTPPTPEHAAHLLHELEVHRVELQMQNEALRAAQDDTELALERYTDLFDFAPLAYVVLDSVGTVREANFEGARLLCIDRERLVGRPFRLWVDVPDREGFDVFLKRALAQRNGAAAHEVAVLTLLPEGANARLDVRLFGSAAGPFQALVGLNDITALRRAETALRDEVRHRDEFIAALSRELHNPLAPIRANLAVLDRLLSGGEHGVKARAEIDHQLLQLTRIADELGDVTRLATGALRLTQERIELGGVVGATLEALRPEFEAGAVKLEAQLPATAVWVDADLTRVRQVIENLLSSALRSTPGKGRVEVQLEARAGHAVLSVRDDGAGFSPEMRDGLFQPFRQTAKTPERSLRGLGLGLALVKGLVALHEGTVAVTSPGVGKGTQVTVRLPLTGAPGQAVAPPPAASPAPAP
jgi:two-component system CheB/CheR fusion protein